MRNRLRDTGPKNRSFDSIEYDEAIADAYMILRARLPAPRVLSSSAFTISAGGDTFSLPTTVTQWTGGDGQAEYTGDLSIRLRSNSQFLVKRTVEELDALRHGQTTLVLSIPETFALWEDKNQLVNGRCYPGALASEVCDLFHALAADDLRDYVGSGTDDMDDVEVLFSRQGSTALILYVAADLLARMTEDDLSLRKLNPEVADSWRAEAERLLYREEARQHDLADVGRPGRWVS